MSLQRIQMVSELLNQEIEPYTLIDVGCRTMDLKPYLKNCKEYFGTDLIPHDGVIACNLEKPLQFDDNQFDIVCALDVLEHVDNIHDAIEELFRIAKRSVIISLPNMHYISFRLRFLAGRGVSGKYTFHPYKIIDRHKWLLSYDEAFKFIVQYAIDSNLEILPIIPIRGRTRYFVGPIERILARMWPNLFVYGLIAKYKIKK